MKIKASMREALEDDALLGKVMPGESWKVWRTLLIASRGEPLEPDEKKIFRQFTGRKRAPSKPVDEFWAIVGRRGGKSRAEAVCAAYYGALCTYADVLVPGEEAIVLTIAPDQSQADIIFRYALAALEQSPTLRKSIKRNTSDTIELVGNVSIEVRASNFRRLRGPTLACVLADEVAFWYSADGASANPDEEILRSVRPGRLTTKGPLICMSSSYARKGVLYEAYEKHHGDKGDPDILVAKGSTEEFNPVVDRKVIKREYDKDPVAAAAEYGSTFRSDVEAFLSKEAIDAVIQAGTREIPPQQGMRYWAFVDPSGGSKDSFTLAVGHRFEDRCIVDCIREVRPPLSPEAVVKEFAHVLKTYRIARIKGDHYAGMFPVELFAKYGIDYRQHAKPKSVLYLSMLAAVNSQQVELLEHERLRAQLLALERRTSRGGRDSIDHPPNGRDDVANAVAGLVHDILVAPANQMHVGLAAPIMVDIESAYGDDDLGYSRMGYYR